MGNTKSHCVIGVVNKPTRSGRDPFAPLGVPGNRWIRFGCDGPITGKERAKIEKAVELAYALHNKAKFTEAFDKVVKVLATKGQTLSYVDALDAMTLHLAETSTNSEVQKEVKESLAFQQANPKQLIEAGFTLGRTGEVYIRKFALQRWNTMELASLIMHEAAHVAGAAGDQLAEIGLLKLDQIGYRRPTKY